MLFLYPITLCFCSQLQDSTNTYRARWDVSGDPCPAVNYKWKVQRLDGLVVADWKDMDCMLLIKYGVND